jgi:hypothetical protein
MDEANKIKEEKTEIGLATATLAGVGARPEVRAVATSSVRRWQRFIRRSRNCSGY